MIDKELMKELGIHMETSGYLRLVLCDMVTAYVVFEALELEGTFRPGRWIKGPSHEEIVNEVDITDAVDIAIELSFEKALLALADFHSNFKNAEWFPQKLGAEWGGWAGLIDIRNAFLAHRIERLNHLHVCDEDGCKCNHRPSSDTSYPLTASGVVGTNPPKMPTFVELMGFMETVISVFEDREVQWRTTH